MKDKDKTKAQLLEELAALRKEIRTLQSLAGRRKESQNALRESDERYRSLFDNIRDFVYTHDLEGRFLTINRLAAQTIGYAPQELIGLHISDLMLPEHRRAFYDEYLPQIKEQGFFNGVTLYLAKDAGRNNVKSEGDLKS